MAVVVKRTPLPKWSNQENNTKKSTSREQIFFVNNYYAVRKIQISVNFKRF